MMPLTLVDVDEDNIIKKIGGKPEVWQIVGYYLVLAAAVWIYRAGVKKSENGKIFAWKIRAVYAGMVCFAILMISYRPHEDFRIACLDVGQGDGIVVEIEYPDRRGQYE